MILQFALDEKGMEPKDFVRAWNDVAERFVGGTLLVGNGGSIALSPSFSYKSLYQSGINSGEINPRTQETFVGLFKEDRDFEKLLRRLWAADYINEKFGIEKSERDKVRKPYTDTRRALINTVKHIHPGQDELVNGLLAISQFCSVFSNVFTLNYDLTLTWAAELNNNSVAKVVNFNDGFVLKTNNMKLDSFLYNGNIGDNDIGIYYPHGSLCLCQSRVKMEEKKLSPNNEGDLYFTKLTDYWAKNESQPLFVCEGRSEDKYRSISGSHYLSAAYDKLKSNKAESLVIYGWSISKNDQHILDAISNNNSYERAAVSVRKNNKEYQVHARQALTNAGIKDVCFFDSESQGCWANR